MTVLHHALEFILALNLGSALAEVSADIRKRELQIVLNLLPLSFSLQSEENLPAVPAM